LGVVPLRNSSSGLVSDTAESIVRRLIGVTLPSAGSWWKSQLCVASSFPLSVRHCLVGWGQFSQIRTVVSKHQAIQQCQGWLRRNLPKAETEAADSSAGSIAGLEASPDWAAIVSQEAAHQAGVPILASDIQDNPDNETEFVVVQCDSQAKSGFAESAGQRFVEYWIGQFQGVSQSGDPIAVQSVSERLLASVRLGQTSDRLLWQHCFEWGGRYYWFGKIDSDHEFSSHVAVTRTTSGAISNFSEDSDQFSAAWRLGAALVQ